MRQQATAMKNAANREAKLHKELRRVKGEVGAAGEASAALAAQQAEVLAGTEQAAAEQPANPFPAARRFTQLSDLIGLP